MEKLPSSKYLGILLIFLGLLGIFLTSSRISSIQNETDIYGLGDATTISCDQYDSLNSFFGADASSAGCDASSDELQRASNQESLPTMKNYRLMLVIPIFIGVVLLFLPKGTRKLPVVGKASNVGQSNDRDNDIRSQLEQLENLKKSNLINNDEYQAKRSEILGRL